MEKKLTKELVGKVVSDKANKTVSVLVENYKKDSKYGKRVRTSKKYAAHDESNKAKIGDTVRIVETKPISKTKTFYVAEIIKEAIII
ncbi:MAG: 30S ribosomal protein S17 [Bacilli bacterium]